jgi:CheY-like chemotaxis protein
LVPESSTFFYTPGVPSVIALIDDLMFLSRVREAARGLGLEVKSARGAADALEAVRAGAALLVVDLDSKRLPWAETVVAIRAEPALVVPVVGFLSHVNADTAREATAVGCTRVLARSAFVQELPRLLATTIGAVSPREVP